MTKNGIVLTVVALLLACIYVYFFTDLLVKPRMQIIPVIRPDRPSSIPRSDDNQVYPVAFKLDREYRLTSVKVLVAAEVATNKYAPPLWHMVSDSQSAPTDAIVYGGQIKGMKPKVPRARPSPLEPGVPYLLIVEAGNVVGQTNFATKAVVKTR
jgi:hypothetical protein